MFATRSLCSSLVALLALACASAGDPSATRVTTNPASSGASGATSSGGNNAGGVAIVTTAGATATGGSAVQPSTGGTAGVATAGAGGTEPAPEPGDASFHGLTASATSVGVYDMLVATFHSSIAYQNPFDQDDIKVDLVAAAPDGASVIMPAFFKQSSANPFSTAKGGPCAKTADFFTDATAKRHYKNKLRYAVARWGADPQLAVWELWNEYDHLVEQLAVPTAAIAAWHQEMARYLRQTDPYGRIITTSLSHNDYADLWRLPEMQFSQRHLYGSTESLATTLGGYETKYQKPFVSGEFSLDWKWPQMHPASEYGRELHLGLWRGMFAPTPILPMTWWWDFHADNNQYFHFEHASTMAAKTAEGPGPLEPQAVTASGGVEVLALKSPSGRFVWLHNKGGAVINGASVTLTDLPAAAFAVRSFNTWNGAWGDAVSLAASGGSLRLDLPTLAGDADMAYWLAAP
jgi:hypothetical protein